MALNPYLATRLEAIRDTLMAQHRGGRGLPNAVIGSERETFLREFLQKVFPVHRRFSTGAITDAEHRISGQVDVAVEYGQIPSFPMPNSEERVLLAESVAIVIEVKSDLSSQWGQVRETVSKVRPIRRTLNPVMVMGPTPEPRIPCVAVGYTGHTTVEGLAERLATTDESERPDAALVIESGCFTGFGLTAQGPLGMYALCLVINRQLGSLAIANPNLLAYAQ
jgi:hypothetical protein